MNNSLKIRTVKEYIFQMKGIDIQIIPPRNEREQQLLEQAYQTALRYFGSVNFRF